MSNVKAWRRLLFGCPLMVVSLFLSCAPSAPEDQPLSSIVDLVQQGASDIFYLPAESYESLSPTLPIGVFDSGIGGLTVLEQILKVDRFDNENHTAGADGRPDFEAESFVYLGDQANMPYGNYPSEGKVDFLDELILKDALFILGDRYWPSRSAELPLRDKPPVKAIVIACNTATSYGLEDIEDALEKWRIPLYLVGVVAAGADGVVEELAPLPEPGAVAVMATVATCSAGGYVREIDRAATEAGMTSPVVVQQGSLGLAGAIEGSPEFIVSEEGEASADYRGPAIANQAAPIDEMLIDAYGFDPAGILGEPDEPASWRLNSIDNYIQYDTTTLLETHRRSGSTEPITAVVLGCTHFPYYTGAIERSFRRLRAFRTPDGDAPYENLIADDLRFVDPAVLTATQLYEALAERGLLKEKNDAPPTDEFFVSVPNGECPNVELLPDGRSFTYAFKYGRSPGQLDREYVKRVPMSRANLSAETLENIRLHMPAVWERMVVFGETSRRLAGVPEEDRIGRVPVQ